MLQELEPYIAKYYDRWLRYSDYMCGRFGIRCESYDIMMNVLADLCEKPNVKLQEFLAVESKGSKLLYNYICKAILFSIIDFKKRIPCRKIDIDHIVLQLSVPSDNTNSATNIPNEVRETEAMTREESFMIPRTITSNTLSIPAISVARSLYRKKDNRLALRIVYRSYVIRNKSNSQVIYGNSREGVLTRMLQYQHNV